jgi:chromosome partitioning protein
MFDAQTKLSSEVVQELQRFIEEAKGQPLPWAEAVIFRSKIRRNIKLAECPSFGQPVTAYDSASNGAADYRALAKEVLALGQAPAPAPEQPAPVEKKPAAEAKPPAAAAAPQPKVAVSTNPAAAAAAATPSKTVVQPVKKAPAKKPPQRDAAAETTSGR